MKWTVEQILRHSGDFPSLPTVYYELSRAVDDPRATVDSIATIIATDQSMASRLLRMANSAFYGFPRRVDTLPDALHLIGLREVRDLALATAVLDKFTWLPDGLVDVNAFWEHSVACAVGAGLLATARHEPHPERFFVGGLLHDIGRLALFLKLPGESRDMIAKAADSGQLLVRVERDTLGFDHAEVGGALLQWWRLPPTLVEMVRFHHSPTLSQLAITEASLVHIADLIANALQLGSSAEQFVPPLSEEGWSRSHLDPACLEPLMGLLIHQTDEMMGILKGHPAS